MCVERYGEDLQPIWRLVVREFVDELIHDSVNSDCPTDEFKFSIVWIAEDEMVAVEVGQLLASDTSGELRAFVSKFAF